MIRQRIATGVLALWALVLCAVAATAEMGPCTPADFDLICGSGDGAAHVIVKTISPSKRLGFAWRLANKPPTIRPEHNDPNLENVIVRIEDGALLAKSRGAYWDLSTKIAKAYLMTAWSPDSRLLIKVEQRETSAVAELFSFTNDDVALGPFDLGKIIQPPMLAKLQGVEDTSQYGLVFPAHPNMTVDDQGLIHVVVHTIGPDASFGPIFDATLQVLRGQHSLDAQVVSIMPHRGTSISIIVH